MSVIFDLKDQPKTWAASVNEDLIADCPEYINRYGQVGSDEWWNKYQSAEIDSIKKQGEVVFIGERADQFHEIWDIVEINIDGELTEYDRCGYWENEAILVGSIIFIESFEISLKQKYGPKTHSFDRLVEIIKT